ncbi:hypothetical protein V495_06724 [Pseudogymnoascus sp. VKM F-4514 (FW-929)]|nr:hypothetical protein V495_06724 [Pseudogymnoascus sp. VKM F-4514 (FW-929)]
MYTNTSYTLGHLAGAGWEATASQAAGDWGRTTGRTGTTGKTGQVGKVEMCGMNVKGEDNRHNRHNTLRHGAQSGITEHKKAHRSEKKKRQANIRVSIHANIHNWTPQTGNGACNCHQDRCSRLLTSPTPRGSKEVLPQLTTTARSLSLPPSRFVTDSTCDWPHAEM